MSETENPFAAPLQPAPQTAAPSGETPSDLPPALPPLPPEEQPAVDPTPVVEEQPPVIDEPPPMPADAPPVVINATPELDAEIPTAPGGAAPTVRKPKSAFYRAKHDGIVYPALKFPPGYEDDHPNEFEPAEAPQEK